MKSAVLHLLIAVVFAVSTAVADVQISLSPQVIDLGEIVAGGCCTDNFCHEDCCGGCQALGLSTSGDEYHPDLTKCLFFEKGYYGKIAGVMSGWKNLSAVSGVVGDGPNGA